MTGTLLKLKAHLAELTAYALAPLLALTGFRFSKDYRHGVTAFHRAMYAVISTPVANILADRIRGIE
jgi:hypothetical protein